MQPEKLVLISPWFPTSAPDLSALGDAEGDILPLSLLAAGHDLYGPAICCSAPSHLNLGAFHSHPLANEARSRLLYCRF